MVTRQKSIFQKISIIIALLVAIGGITLSVFLVKKSDTSEEKPPEVSTVPGSSKPYNFDYSWTKHPYIAHAFGGILGESYTNSYEAFLLNYQLGHRIFEVDFYLTDDSKTVAAHDAEHWAKNATLPDNLHVAGTKKRS